jgi:hypothetical protein
MVFIRDKEPRHLSQYMIRLRGEQSTNRGSNTGKDNRFMLYQKLPHRLRGPPKGYALVQFVHPLRYEPEGRGFYTRLGH